MTLKIDSYARADSIVQCLFFEFKMQVGVRKGKKKFLLINNLHLDTLVQTGSIRSLSLQKADGGVPLRPPAQLVRALDNCSFLYLVIFLCFPPPFMS